MKALVTGAEGTIGGNLVRILAGKGVSVRVLGEGVNPPALKGVPVEIVQGNILSLEDVLSALRGIHCVFHSLQITCEQELQKESCLLNLEGTKNLLIGMSRSGISRLVHISSAFTFESGTLKEPGDECSSPASSFGLASLDSIRRAAELVRRYTDEGNVQATILAPTLVCGKYDSPGSPGWFLLDVASTSKRYPPGGINLIGAKEVAFAAVEAYEKGKTGETYIIAGENLSYREIFSIIARTKGKEPPSKEASHGILAFGSFYHLLASRFMRKPALSRQIAAIAASDLFYSGTKAMREFGISTRSAVEIINEAIEWMEEFNAASNAY